MQLKLSKTETNDRSFGNACFFSFEYLLLFINKEKKSDYSINQWNNGKQMKILVY